MLQMTRLDMKRRCGYVEEAMKAVTTMHLAKTPGFGCRLVEGYHAAATKMEDSSLSRDLMSAFSEWRDTHKAGTDEDHARNAYFAIG